MKLGTFTLLIYLVGFMSVQDCVAGGKSRSRGQKEQKRVCAACFVVLQGSGCQNCRQNGDGNPHSSEDLKKDEEKRQAAIAGQVTQEQMDNWLADQKRGTREGFGTAFNKENDGRR